jgi:hypothetical protein
MSESLDYLISNGLTETTSSEESLYQECQASSISLERHWSDVNNSSKIITWDAEWEKYLLACAEFIKYNGEMKFLPWQAYKALGLTWLDGYAYTQNSGDCASFGHKNSLKASMFTAAIRTGLKPFEIAQSMQYALARGNGKPNFGSGCNLNPMAKYAAQVGNYWTSDFGKYNTGAYTRQYSKGGTADNHALQSQSIIAYLPSPSFEHCYKVCSAGFGINIGTGVFPISSSVNKDNLGVVSAWKNGGHSVALVAAIKGASGTPYLYLENSHGARYAADKYSDGKQQFGCYVTEADIAKMSTTRYGVWYANLVELPRR